jgi:hypothetical protein
MQQQMARQSGFQRHLYSPETTMWHRAELEISDKQRADLIRLIQEFQSAIVAVEWDLQDAKVELERQLEMFPTSQKAVEQALDTVLVHERQIKKRYMIMLVKAKNVLIKAQIDTLETKSRNRFTSWVGQGDGAVFVGPQ